MAGTKISNDTRNSLKQIGKREGAPFEEVSPYRKKFGEKVKENLLKFLDERQKIFANLIILSHKRQTFVESMIEDFNLEVKENGEVKISIDTICPIKIQDKDIWAAGFDFYADRELMKSIIQKICSLTRLETHCVAFNEDNLLFWSADCLEFVY